MSYPWEQLSSHLDDAMVHVAPKKHLGDMFYRTKVKFSFTAKEDTSSKIQDRCQI